MKVALENDCIPLTQKTVFNDYLNIYSHMIDSSDIDTISQVIEDYQKIYEKIFANLKSAINKKDYFNFIEGL